MKKFRRIMVILVSVILSLTMITSCVNNGDNASSGLGDHLTASSVTESESTSTTDGSSSNESSNTSTSGSSTSGSSSTGSSSTGGSTSSGLSVSSSAPINQNPSSNSPNVPVIPASKYGLQVTSEGVVTLNGKTFYGMGVNQHGAFRYGELAKALGHKGQGIGINIDGYFKPLLDNGIPFVRCQLGVFYANEVKYYVDQHDLYMQAMDKFFAKAEEYNIGIIASLMWNLGTFCEYYGEPVSEIANPNSKGVKLAVKYVTEIAERYKDCPALWAYEIGNEGNLGVDLRWIGPQHMDLTTAQLNSYYKIISAAIKAKDPNRLLVAGDSEPRGSSKALRTRQSWAPADTYADTKETMSYYSPNPLNAISVHMYNESSDPASVRDFNTPIAKYMKIAKELKKALFVGEFGPASDIGDFNACANAIVSNGVQLSAAWCYRRDEQPSDGTSITPGARNNDAWLKIISVNKNYKSRGLTETSEYWAGVTNKFYK